MKPPLDPSAARIVADGNPLGHPGWRHVMDGFLVALFGLVGTSIGALVDDREVGVPCIAMAMVVSASAP